MDSKIPCGYNLPPCCTYIPDNEYHEPWEGRVCFDCKYWYALPQFVSEEYDVCAFGVLTDEYSSVEIVRRHDDACDNFEEQ